MGREEHQVVEAVEMEAGRSERTELSDKDLLDEVALTTDLIVAVAEYDRHLDPDEVDRLIGILPSP